MPMEFRGTYSSPLTSDQRKALNAMMAWVNDKSSIEFTLSGFAGTGKTYLLNHFVKNYKRSICVTAPTHKAVKKASQATGIAGKTIQSLHGLRPNFNIEFNSFKDLKFDTIGVPRINSYSLVIIDEASMITQGLKELNRIRASQYGVKILYVGDEAQLPPVNESISSVFSIPGYKLTEIVRQQANNPLLKILAIAREDVFKGSDKLHTALLKRPVDFNENGEGYIVLDRLNFTDTIVKYFNSSLFSNNVDFVRYGSYSNDNILAWNNAIRNAIIPNNSELVTENDLMTGYKTIVDPFMNPILTNSCDYMITDIVTRITDDKFSVYSATLTDDEGKKQIVSIVNPKSDDYGQFLHKLNVLQKRAKYANIQERSKRWTEFYNFKDSYLITCPIMLPDERFPIPKDIDYGYGLTVHKLQGSTLENVFINLPDIMMFSTGSPNPLRQRLLYTAISRASKRVAFLK